MILAFSNGQNADYGQFSGPYQVLKSNIAFRSINDRKSLQNLLFRSGRHEKIFSVKNACFQLLKSKRQVISGFLCFSFPHKIEFKISGILLSYGKAIRAIPVLHK